MQTQQPKQAQQAPPSDAVQRKVSPQPWVKPTFEQAPLNEALAAYWPYGGADHGSYAS
jgi:hypothetical protein